MTNELDGRGPFRTISRVVLTDSWTNLFLDCGHISESAPHFHYTVGERVRCFDCGTIARSIVKIPTGA